MSLAVPGRYVRACADEARAVDALGLSSGATRISYTTKDAHIDALADHLHPITGAPLYRQQSNSRNEFLGFVYRPGATVQLWVHTLSDAELKQFAQEAVRIAAQVGERRNGLYFGRSGAQGRDKTPVDLVTLWTVGLDNRNGQRFFHVHEFHAKVGVDPKTGNTLTLDKTTGQAVAKDFKSKQLEFNLLLGQLLEQKFGLKVDIRHGFVEIPAISYAQVQKRNTRAQDARDYLAARNIPPTRTAMAYASQNVRKQKGKAQPQPEMPDAEKVRIREVVKRRPDEPTLFQRFVLAPAQVYYYAARKVAIDRKRARDGARVIYVKDPEQFLELIRTPSNLDRHKAAIRAVRRTRCKSFIHALQVAERGFKAAGKPELPLYDTDRIKIASGVTLTRDQQREIETIAARRGAKVIHLRQGQTHRRKM